MGHTRDWCGIGVWLAVAGSLWAAAARAQDAGMGAAGGVDVSAGDAGSGGGVDANSVDGGTPGVASSTAGELVYPPPGGTAVVLNPGLIVRIPLAALGDRDASSNRSAFGAGLLVRDDAGGLVALGPIVALETARPDSSRSYFEGVDWPAPMSLPNSRVELATAPLALSPGRRYEVLSRMATCPTTDGLAIACLGDEYVGIGAFTTGTELDSKAPVFESATLGDSPGTCLAALTLTASDDHAASNAIRFTTDEDGFLGPDLVLPVPRVPSRDELATLRLIPIDPSGNRGAPFEVEVDGCPSPVPDYASPIDTQPRPVTNQESDSCSIMPAAGLGELRGLGVVALAALLVLGPRRARG
jgi:hypothetical protein